MESDPLSDQRTVWTNLTTTSQVKHLWNKEREPEASLGHWFQALDFSKKTRKGMFLQEHRPLTSHSILIKTSRKNESFCLFISFSLTAHFKRQFVHKCLHSYRTPHPHECSHWLEWQPLFLFENMRNENEKTSTSPTELKQRTMDFSHSSLSWYKE